MTPEQLIKQAMDDDAARSRKYALERGARIQPEEQKKSSTWMPAPPSKATPVFDRTIERPMSVQATEGRWAYLGDGTGQSSFGIKVPKESRAHTGDTIMVVAKDGRTSPKRLGKLHVVYSNEDRIYLQFKPGDELDEDIPF